MLMNILLLPYVIRTYQKTGCSTADFASGVNTLQAMMLIHLKICLFLVLDQMLNSPWVRQFQEFQADLGVPADLESRQLLSLRGNRALPGDSDTVKISSMSDNQPVKQWRSEIQAVNLLWVQ